MTKTDQLTILTLVVDLQIKTMREKAPALKHGKADVMSGVWVMLAAQCIIR